MQDIIRTELSADGVLLATIDMTDRTMNVFSVELMDALDALMDRVDSDPAVSSCVVTSGKPSFLAGADLVMVRGYCDAAATSTHAQMFEMCGRLGRQFVRLEASAKPWVAAVNGLALGGGLELALACRVRLVADDPRLQLGVPEVRWGLLPGAGGTQRLPRLAGFESAMGLLLSGKSMTPASAVQLGVFHSAVAPADLLDRACAIAGSLHGQPYDVRAKFAQLAQADVPEHSDEVARQVALRHGVSTDDYGIYPAYGAIVDSVLKGARLPLAEANAVEMNQFLRLMFSPVAGRMVRTLFLERLRAERELAAPDNLKITALRRGPISAVNQAWSDALAKIKLPQTEDASLAPDTLLASDSQGGEHHIALAVLGSPASSTTAATLPLALLAPPGPYGRVLEIVAAEAATSAALAALAARLWSLPWHSPGPAAVLPQLVGLPLPQQADIAARCAALPGAGDAAFLDVAACLAGIAPAWSGGPLTWARGELAAAKAA